MTTLSRLSGGISKLNKTTGRTATYVVAASDAPSHVKAQADYVCDGTADNVQIQAAINALPAGGGLVLLTEGTFTLASGLTLGANDSISGISAKATILDASALTSDIAITVGNYTTVSKLTISGGDTDGIEIQSNDVKITDVRIDSVKNGTTNYAVAIHATSSSAHDVVIDGVYIYDCDRGIEIEDGAYNVVAQNGYIDTVPAVGANPLYSLDCHSHDHSTNPVTGIKFKNFYITNSAGIGATGTDDITFENITIAAPTRLSAAAPGKANGVVKIINSYFTGQDDGSATDLAISGTGTVIIDNVKFDSIHGTYGIQVSGGTLVADNLVMVAGLTTLADYGIYSAAGTVVKVSNSLFSGSLDTPAKYWLSIGGTLYLDGSLVTGHANGIYIRSGSTNCKIIGNSLPAVNADSGSNTLWRDNTGKTSSGDIVTIVKSIDHAALIDSGGATAYVDFDDEIPAGSIIKAVKVDYTEAFNSDDTTTLTLQIGDNGGTDPDQFNKTENGENAFNTTTDVFWGESSCRNPIVTTATTPRLLFTEDDDGTDLISSTNAQGAVTVTITYMKA